MTKPFKAACVQNSAIDDIDHNIRDTGEMIARAVDAGADLVCLPEYFACLEEKDTRYIERGFDETNHPALAHFTALARDIERWLLLGSLAIKVSDSQVANRSFVIAADGSIQARYDKIHLFDVSLKRGEMYRESNTVAAGAAARIAQLPWGILGLSVCYDVRFPQLYRSLAQAGADFISIPAAFTATTGAAHWHVLVRARAIETGSFVFAPGQCGRRPWGRRTYGHSLIVDPWGEVLADAGDEPGFIVAEVDPAKVLEARSMIPALTHDRAIASPEFS